jgi:hypothetical protein
MYVKRWVVFVAMTVVASLPAYGNSSISISQTLDASPSDIAFIADQSPAKREESLLFRNTLDVSAKGNEILMATWERSRQTEINQERIAILPEPGSGVLLTIGLFALVYYLGRTERTRVSSSALVES